MTHVPVINEAAQLNWMGPRTLNGGTTKPVGSNLVTDINRRYASLISFGEEVYTNVEKRYFMIALSTTIVLDSPYMDTLSIWDVVLGALRHLLLVNLEGG